MDYENMSTSEVLRLAKQGDKDALYEMRYRYPDNEEAPGMVWAAFWDEKAAAKGHVYAKMHLARFFKDMPVSANFSNNRQKAMSLFESMIKDYETGKLDKEYTTVGIFAKLELGIMLCEGLGTERDCKRGVDLLTRGEEEMKPFGGLRYVHLCRIGELYGQGYAQDDEEATANDLKKSIEYLENAIKKAKEADPNPQMIDYIKKYIDIMKERLPAKINLEGFQTEDLEIKKRVAAERREKLSQPSENGRIVEDSIRKLRERFTREGW